MTHSVTAAAVDPPNRSDAEVLLERACDEGLGLESSLDDLLRHLDRRHAAELAAARRGVRA